MEDVGFVVKVVDVCVGCEASGYSEGCVLNCLKFFCVGGRGDGDQMVLAYSSVGRVIPL